MTPAPATIRLGERPADPEHAYRVAVHESGHACVAALLGFMPAELGFAADGRGLCGLTALVPDDGHTDWLRATLVAAFAGPEAERRFLVGRGQWSGPASGLPSYRADYDFARRLALEGTLSRAEADELLAEADAEAEEFLADRRLWLAVAGVAHLIDEHDVVYGYLVIQTGRSSTTYRLEEFPTGWDGRGFRLVKLDGGTDPEAESYSVFCSQRGPEADSCECRGCERYGTCKHKDAMRALVSNGWL